jgi:hypothetical protein
VVCDDETISRKVEEAPTRAAAAGSRKAWIFMLSSLLASMMQWCILQTNAQVE